VPNQAQPEPPNCDFTPFSRTPLAPIRNLFNLDLGALSNRHSPFRDSSGLLRLEQAPLSPPPGG